MNTRLLRSSLGVLQKEIARKMTSSYLPAPYFVVFSITHRCNARCVMCDHWQSNDSSQEISIKTWKDILLGLRRWAGLPYLVLTGGEPFVKEGFLELAGLASSLGYYTDVATNGLALSRETAERLIISKPSVVQFSLYSHLPEVHDRIKGVANLHRTITDAVAVIRSKSPGTRIAVCCVITKDNYSALADFTVWATDALGVDYINFQPLITGFGYALHGLAAEPPSSWTAAELEMLDSQLRALGRLRVKGYPVNVSPRDLKNFLAYFQRPDNLPRKDNCDTGTKNLIVLPDASVKLCYKFPAIGNAAKQSLEEIWSSDAARKQRVEMAQCKKTCVSGCSRGYTFTDKVFNFLIKAEPRVLKTYRKLNRVFGR